MGKRDGEQFRPRGRRNRFVPSGFPSAENPIPSIDLGGFPVHSDLVSHALMAIDSLNEVSFVRDARIGLYPIGLNLEAFLNKTPSIDVGIVGVRVVPSEGDFRGLKSSIANLPEAVRFGGVDLWLAYNRIVIVSGRATSTAIQRDFLAQAEFITKEWLR